MSYSIQNVIEITIKDDHDLCRKFLGWQLGSDVYPVPGGGYSGLGGYRGYFGFQDAEALEKFFAEHG
jgi:hypothetical protein